MHLTVLLLFSAASFFGYGLSCLASRRMRTEFARYGLSGYRKLTGALQLLGAAGLLIGLQHALVGAMAAAGLALLMLLGFGVRLKIKDGFLKSSPAFLYLVLNAYLAFALSAAHLQRA